MVLGRDARISCDIVQNLVSYTLLSCGVDICDIGLTTTPTLAMGVVFHRAQTGVMLSASHNPEMWNALKILDENGEFIDEATGREIYRFAEDRNFDFAEIDALGKIEKDTQAIQKHVEAILSLDLIQREKIAKAGFTVVLDAINSTGNLAIPILLEALGVEHIIKLNAEPTGRFAHDPEPLEDHLGEICHRMKTSGGDVGFAVDPDVDRLAIIDERGNFFGEEYTLVACADYTLQHEKGDTVSNLSSSQALARVTQKMGFSHHNAAVGEFHVVKKMKEVDAVIGGEGNGGVILPSLHYGRDAMVGIALFLSYMADSRLKCSQIRSLYPNFFMSKKKVVIKPDIEIASILDSLSAKASSQKKIRFDGLKMIWQDEWVHIRASNTEPVLRIYAEAATLDRAEHLAQQYERLILAF